MNRYAVTTLFMTLSLLLVRFSESKIIDNIFPGNWDGVSLHLATNRGLVQEKLDTHYGSFEVYNADNSPKLYLPEYPVFPGILTSDQHPVFLDFSRVTSFDLKQNIQGDPEGCLSPSRMEVTLTIPLLAQEPSGPPLYALGIGVLYERSRRDFPRANVLYPYIPVDEITMDDNGVVVRNGSEEIRATFIKYDDPCQPPPTIVRYEIKEFVESDLHFGLPEPDVSFCGRLRPLNQRFCSFAEKFGSDFHLNGPNICEKWNDFDHDICKTSVKITNISPRFRNLMLLDNGPINVIASETYVGNFTVGLTYPCIEQP